MTNKRRRSQSELARDRKRTSELYLKGWLQHDIAKELNIDQSTISRDIASLIDEWRTSTKESVNELKARELSRINLLEETYWQQFQASQDPIVKRKTSKRINTDDDPNWKTTEATQEVSLGTGDPRFLQGVQWCIDRRCKLLGLDASTTSKNLNIDLNQLTDNQLERIADGDDPLAVISTSGKSKT